MNNIYLLMALTLLASISPLLTFAYLWQIKEWRIDRLKEHIRAEGFFRQFFGLIRPALLVIFIPLAFTNMREWHLHILIILSILSCVQIMMHRQPKPVWTMKALSLVLGSIFITIAISASIILYSGNLNLLAILPYVQTITLVISWMLFFPMDRLLKIQILKKASKIRGMHPNLTVVGITGSAGKTTTKELLKHLLSDKNMMATPEHTNSEIGVARWIKSTLSKNETPEILIVEMGAYRPKEIAKLCYIAKPTIGVLTTIGKQHLALFGSQEALCNAKAELIESLPESGHAYINVDNELCNSVKNRTKGALTTIGTGGHSDLEAYEIEETGTGINFRVSNMFYKVPIHGTHNVTNVLLAIAVAKDLGMDEHEIARKLLSFKVPSRTFYVSVKKGVTVLNDTHNASPSSFRAAIAWAHNQNAEEKILITNGLMELGQLQDSIHTKLGSMASDKFSRVIFLSKRNAKNFQKGFNKPVEIYNKEIKSVPEKSLLVCIGRMSNKTINSILPK
ncbi:UDP-N-acetylmuramoyl-tripeptide--D-alanyl-D-alanine ligase [Candidatus Peregrinibacteria bacterium]|jgi:UDP-N-acetylmuramoyl-tripeptide--D-alanyl-D-alanine ligase|nr:UDP-N-acetylmuramoyl-tripeptide--D-alanyl-D-alanine ligase [Candidatus Peregrinibacteria bacterium]MBT3599054.1 UDP-N-acetylmuramoyl-tripeptide--D-alanyl-D-alanine ligase [Candidatus Peregrinibacteria bacterium]MBT4367197.1 UDP-N-acetylmuramoyl-tripeptide--D-alanyl-D-alanine ligase [Candidatus Peregrinibacteria bacterium]MBT4585266.1 UDP-N-acetylmuramoyl-tripeptide--D-alanyl-D-alanine ligase [Candidatus Peregrinibacteria bacterium]MBT6730640.1 UDP-N-acetylmuramoyl-tripeptide--D-alanyl-D-alan